MSEFMQYALELAEHGRYSVSPNPMVGCVIVKSGRIIGEGFHQRAGLFARPYPDAATALDYDIARMNPDKTGIRRQ